MDMNEVKTLDLKQKKKHPNEFLKEIVETQLGDRYYLDDFQAWYLVESEEAIDLAYKYIKLKRIWLGQEIFTFFDSKIKGLVDAKSLQKAFHRLNINIDSQNIWILNSRSIKYLNNNQKEEIQKFTFEDLSILG